MSPWILVNKRSALTVLDEQRLPSFPQTIEFDEGAGAVLRIQPLRAPRDENTYECVAENVEGEVTVHAMLSIIRGESRTRRPVFNVDVPGLPCCS